MCKRTKSQSRLKTNEQFLKQLKENNIDVESLEEYKGNNNKILFRCSCGELWKTTPQRVLIGNHCKKCGYKNMQGENNYFFFFFFFLVDFQNLHYRFRNPLYKDFTKKCSERDDYTCQISDKKSTGDIVVHHINGYNWDIKNRTNVDNGITLNTEVHKKFHKIYGKGNNTKEQFIEFLETLYNQGEISMERKILILERLNNIK